MINLTKLIMKLKNLLDDEDHTTDGTYQKISHWNERFSAIISGACRQRKGITKIAH